MGREVVDGRSVCNGNVMVCSVEHFQPRAIALCHSLPNIFLSLSHLGSC